MIITAPLQLMCLLQYKAISMFPLIYLTLQVLHQVICWLRFVLLVRMIRLVLFFQTKILVMGDVCQSLKTDKPKLIKPSKCEVKTTQYRLMSANWKFVILQLSLGWHLALAILVLERSVQRKISIQILMVCLKSVLLYRRIQFMQPVASKLY